MEHRTPDRRLLPPLPRLVAFEAAAHCLNFSRAAQSLGTTQSAVSQHVAALEKSLGRPLFIRLHRGLRLTEAGALLLEGVQQGLDSITRTLAALKREAVAPRLTIATDFAFASYWLMPRLSALAAALPGVEVRMVTTQLAFEAAEQDADVTILFGSRREGMMLFPESVLPVCSPGFQARYLSEGTEPDWAALPLLHLDAPKSARWLRWADWFAARDLPPRRVQDSGLRFGTYPLVLEAALIGQGVALGWAPLVDRLLATGGLVPLAAQPVVTDQGYALAMAPHMTEAAQAFRRWLLAAYRAPAAKTP
jgi:putative choline sulfate-utilization transcription factor